jgi:acetoin utilization deacetylase AcuC-like enzyme
MQAEGRVQRVLVIDLDVHQGNGTAEIFADDPSVFTLSAHGAKNFPFRKADSDLDIPLADGTNDADYLQQVGQGIDTAIQRCDPQLVFYVAGVDPYEDDALGRLSLSVEGLALRDAMVFERLGRIPCAVSMAGGYCADVEQIVSLHLQTLSIARSHHQKLISGEISVAPLHASITGGHEWR